MYTSKLPAKQRPLSPPSLSVRLSPPHSPQLLSLFVCSPPSLSVPPPPLSVVDVNRRLVDWFVVSFLLGSQSNHRRPDKSWGRRLQSVSLELPISTASPAAPPPLAILDVCNVPVSWQSWTRCSGVWIPVPGWSGAYGKWKKTIKE